MSQTRPNGHTTRNALLLAAVAAGCGWLLYSRRLNGAGELAGEVTRRVQKLTGPKRPPRVVPRKIAVDEPMAGYGA